MNDLPKGTVTFLFSDLEGSTRLLRSLGGRYPEVLASHRRIVRRAVADHAGHEVDTQGDAFFVSFASAHQAVQCALDIQREMGAEQWPDSHDVRVRIGVHTGHAAVGDEGYTGLAVHRAARICAKASGGQVLVSQATRAILEDEEDDVGFVCVDVGEHELKDFDRPVRLFEAREDPNIAAAPAGRRPSAPTPPARPGPPRIVVLPFANISPDPGDDYFADGMTEELIEKLAHVPGLRVIARTTAMHYKESSDTALEIGRALNVSLVLECSVRKAGSRVRITSQLIDTRSEEHLWASRYDRELDDVFAIQDDISDQITSALTDHVAGMGSTALPRGTQGQQDTTDMEAYTQFLQARELLRKKTSESTIRQALDLFENVAARDPSFGRARVGAAECYLWLAAEGSLPFASSETRAREEIAAALAGNEALAEAHSVLASLMLGADDLAGSAREARRAIELNPSFSDPYRWLAQIEAGSGRIDETVRLLEEAYKIDPLDINVIAFLGRAYFYAGRIEKALDHWDKHQSLAEFRVNAQRLELHLSRREYSKAEERLREMERLRPGNVWVLTYRGFLAAREGDARTARGCVDSLDEMGREGAMTCFHIGFVHFALDELDAFWERMEQALALHSLPMLELLYSPLFARARTDPRYDDLLRRQRETSGSLRA